MKHVLAILMLAGCLCLLGCVPIPLPGREQTSPTIRGRVLDVRTSQPVQGARVQIHERPKTHVLSDSNGEFRVKEVLEFYLMSFVTGQNVYHFPTVRVRSYMLDVSHADYETVEVFGPRKYLGWERPNT